MYVKLAIFAASWVAAIYIVNCLLARKLRQINARTLLTYTSTMAALGLFGELTYDWFYNTLFNKPLWQYQLLPIHNGYTSLFSLFLWGAVGFHIYLLHTTLTEKGIASLHKLALIFCFESIMLEVLVNLSYLAFFKTLIFYYFPTDIWHITSVQTLPLYFLAGYITVIAINQANKLPRWAFAGNSLVLSVLLIFK